MRFECNGQKFRYYCDANEYSWQLCSCYLDGLGDQELYRIREYDDNSFGVLNITTNEWEVVMNVVKL